MSGEHGPPFKLLLMLVDLVYRLGKLADTSQKSEKKATSKHTS